MTLTASEALHVLETFRVPYRVEAADDPGTTGRLSSETGAELLWVRPRPAAARMLFRLGGMSLFGGVADEVDVRRVLEESGRQWEPTAAILGPDDDATGSIWRAPDGSALLPFDPNAVVCALMREEYVTGGSATSLARRLYYVLRPLVPRRVQMAARRRFARVQDRAAFPSWPTESSLHDLYAFVLHLVEDVHGAPLPWIAPWPEPYTWSVVLTHDVERKVGYEHLETVAALEERAGVRSAWYFVPERDYRVDEHLPERLAQRGFEVCVHGLLHDGNDLSPGAFEERLPSMRAYARQWNAVGFRAPATQRDWGVVARLGFEHDSSYSDVARYEPQSGGSCSWLPFFVGDVVELPITLPMDHTVFDLLEHESADVWFEKTRFLRERGGLALLLTHPDYLLTAERLDEYERFASFVAEEQQAWLALPRDVAAWWRRRQASTLEPAGAGWMVRGPAADEARIILGVTREAGRANEGQPASS
jgi:peptidoglycan/xylan/chitin deacetylase (PgdA/CDA1 family)